MINALTLLSAVLGIGVQATEPPAPALPAVASGRIERQADFASKHIPPRNVDVWLPDGYPDAAPYAVLYMHDGQMLFDADTTWNHQEWKIDEVAGPLLAARTLRPFIVVGIWNGGPARHAEYFPQKPFETLDAAQQEAIYALSRAPGTALYSGKVYSDRYLAFLVEELKPWVDSHYRVSGARDDTFVMGSSMGGLISMYALAEYPDVFGGAACLSTHWPGTFETKDNPVPPAFFAYIEKHFPEAGHHRIYFDHGTATLDAMYPDLQRQVDRLIEAKGYGADHWQTRVFPGAEHSEQAWSGRLDVPLKFLLAR